MSCYRVVRLWAFAWQLFHDVPPAEITGWLPSLLGPHGIESRSPDFISLRVVGSIDGFDLGGGQGCRRQIIGFLPFHASERLPHDFALIAVTARLHEPLDKTLLFLCQRVAHSKSIGHLFEKASPRRCARGPLRAQFSCSILPGVRYHPPFKRRPNLPQRTEIAIKLCH